MVAQTIIYQHIKHHLFKQILTSDQTKLPMPRAITKWSQLARKALSKTAATIAPRQQEGHSQIIIPSTKHNTTH
jgi:hypothetical protein